jgi:hypothetical protein
MYARWVISSLSAPLSHDRQDNREKAGKLTVLATNLIPRRDPDLGIAIVAAIGVHPQDILARLVVVDDLWPLDDAVRTKITAGAARQQRPLVFPTHQVRRREAVNVGKGRPAGFVLTDQVVSAVHFDNAGAVRIEVFAVGLKVCNCF